MWKGRFKAVVIGPGLDRGRVPQDWSGGYGRIGMVRSVWTVMPFTPSPAAVTLIPGSRYRGDAP
jgi:hypothetical protein